MSSTPTSLNHLWNDDRDAKRVAVVMGVTLGAGLVGVWFGLSTTTSQMAGLLWAAAWSSIGWFLGFLFGIPRFLSTDTARTPAAHQRENPVATLDSSSAERVEETAGEASAASAAANPAGAEAAASPADAHTVAAVTRRAERVSPTAVAVVQSGGDARSSAGFAAGTGASVTVNTNLEQISDWLTKIIVGVALVETKALVAQMKSAAAFMAESFRGEAGASFSLAIMLYFLASGLLGSYLLTRLFLQAALADAADGRRIRSQ